MIVVTGAAGFIGKQLVRALLEREGETVLGFDNLRRGHWDGTTANERFTAVTGDVRDAQALDAALAGARTVFHLAAQSNVMGAIEDMGYSFSANVAGTLNVLSAAQRAGVRHVVFTSSREVYGEAARLPVDEAFPLTAKNAYGASKVAAEAYCRVFDSPGMRVSVLRLANVYGPGDRDRVIPTFVARALAGLPLVLNGGGQIIDFVPVGVVVEALLRVADSPVATPVNIGSGKGTALPQLARRIIAEAGSSSELVTAPARSAEVVRFVADVARMRAVLGLEPPDDPLTRLPEVIAATRDERRRNGDAAGARTHARGAESFRAKEPSQTVDWRG